MHFFESSFEYTSRSGITELSSTNMLCSLDFFKNGCSALPFYWQCKRVSLLTHPNQSLILSDFPIFWQPDVYKVASFYCFVWISLITGEVEHFFLTHIYIYVYYDFKNFFKLYFYYMNINFYCQQSFTFLLHFYKNTAPFWESFIFW